MAKVYGDSEFMELNEKDTVAKDDSLESIMAWKRKHTLNLYS